MKTPIFGPFSVSRSTNFADNRLVNLYGQIDETKQSKPVGALYLCPGLDLLTTLDQGPVRAMYQMGKYLFVVSGPNLYRLVSNFGSTFIGGGIQPGPVSIIDNGTDIAVFAGNSGHTYTGGIYAVIALPFSPAFPISAAQQDGFGVINQPGSALWWQSDLLDLTTWGALNFGDASGDPDDVVAMAQVNREIWLLKRFETEFWYNAGTLGFTFSRLDGAYLETGIEAQGSLAHMGETLIWLANRREGGSVFVQAKGHSVSRISNHAIETAISRYPTTTDCIGYVYEQAGHQYYVASFPSGNETWCWDATESTLAGTQMWHQLAAFNSTTGLLERHWGVCQCSYAGKNVVGDYRNGNLYAFNQDTLLDNGSARKWLRSWRAMKEPVNRPVSFKELRVDIQTGIDIPGGADNPQAVLRWSDDGGHTWSNEMFSAVGKTGQTAKRLMFRRMGSTRRNSGLDRIFELSSTDAFPAAIVGADLEAS